MELLLKSSQVILGTRSQVWELALLLARCFYPVSHLSTASGSTAHFLWHGLAGSLGLG